MAIKDIAYVRIMPYTGDPRTLQLSGLKAIDFARQLLNIGDMACILSLDHKSITLDEVEEAMFQERKEREWRQNNTRVSKD